MNITLPPGLDQLRAKLQQADAEIDVDRAWSSTNSRRRTSPAISANAECVA